MHYDHDFNDKDAVLVETKPSTTAAGLAAGTIVLTMDGEMPVEHLTAGDRIITRDSGMAVLKELKVSDEWLAPVQIAAGSLGHTRPDRDMIVAPGTAVHIRDWRAEALFGAKSVNVPAHRLVDREFVTELEPRQMRVYTLVFDTAHVVYAGGLEVATA